jgi:hypothetical protein
MLSAPDCQRLLPIYAWESTNVQTYCTCSRASEVIANIRRPSTSANNALVLLNQATVGAVPYRLDEVHVLVANGDDLNALEPVHERHLTVKTMDAEATAVTPEAAVRILGENELTNTTSATP